MTGFFGQDHQDDTHRFVAMRERYGREIKAYYFEDAEGAINCAKNLWDMLTPEERRTDNLYAGKIHAQAIKDETGATIDTWEECHVLWDAWAELGKEAPTLSSATTTSRIRRSGNSLTVTITEQAELLGLGPGDAVEITIRRAAQK